MIAACFRLCMFKSCILVVSLLSSAFLRYSCCKSASLLSEHAIPNLVISFRNTFTSLSTISTFAAFSFLRLSICLRDLWSFYWTPERLLDYYDSVSHTFSFIRAITRREVSALAAFVSFFLSMGGARIGSLPAPMRHRDVPIRPVI